MEEGTTSISQNKPELFVVVQKRWILLWSPRKWLKVDQLSLQSELAELFLCYLLMVQENKTNISFYLDVWTTEELYILAIIDLGSFPLNVLGLWKSWGGVKNEEKIQKLFGR